ncbi:MAG: hypothetical protein GY705_24020 [Bacteroidetes bacterium]|nr:hypothetical protein [Bacteroidota bacterium]
MDIESERAKLRALQKKAEANGKRYKAIRDKIVTLSTVINKGSEPEDDPEKALLNKAMAEVAKAQYSEVLNKFSKELKQERILSNIKKKL